MDPLAEQYYAISPYAVCANNSLKYIDANGREWATTEDEEIAEANRKEAEKRKKELERKEEKIRKKIAKIERNTKLSNEDKQKQLDKQQGKLEDVHFQQDFLTRLQDGIDRLGKSKIVYTFNTEENTDAVFLSSRQDGTIIINNFGTTGSRAHELVHAIQYDNGAFQFSPLGTNDIIGGDMLKREIPAYITEFSITGGILPSSKAKRPRKVRDITPNWLFGISGSRKGESFYQQYR